MGKCDMYSNYFQNNKGYQKKGNIKKQTRILDKEIGSYIDHYNNNIKILEIGVGKGNFAYYCKDKGFKNFTGLELDRDLNDHYRREFTNYKFLNTEGGKYLKNTKETYDIIFMDNVMEHLSLDEGIELGKSIYKKLNKGGIWINIMPNAQALFGACAARYCDITHKILYTEQSFQQLLLIAGFKEENIAHRNYLSGNDVNSLIYRFIPLIRLVPKIYGGCIKTIARK